jgi:hypothetical protein
LAGEVRAWGAGVVGRRPTVLQSQDSQQSCFDVSDLQRSSPEDRLQIVEVLVEWHPAL